MKTKTDLAHMKKYHCRLFQTYPTIYLFSAKTQGCPTEFFWVKKEWLNKECSRSSVG